MQIVQKFIISELNTVELIQFEIFSIDLEIQKITNSNKFLGAILFKCKIFQIH